MSKPIVTKSASQAPKGATPSLPLANDMAVEVMAIGLLREPERAVRNFKKRVLATAKGLMTHHGQLVPVIADDDNVIVAGQEFWLAAKELEWDTIRVVRLSGLSREDRRVVTIALARLAELSSWNEDALRIEFEELRCADLEYDLHDMTGFNIGEIDVIIDPAGDGSQPNALDEVPEPPVADETVTRLGDVWLLDSHRIVCGNSLNTATFDRLMDKKIARMVLADCPYSLPIKGHVSGLGKIKHDDFAMGVGEMSFAEFVLFLKTWLTLSVACLVDGGLCYAFMDRRHLEELHIAGREAGLRLFDLAFWNKLGAGMGSFYRSQHEPCVIFKHGTAPHRNNIELGKNGRHRTNVWDHLGFSSFGRGRNEALSFHPTVKPVNLLAEAMKDCTKRGEIVLDPFLGSGSTILAAEKTGRIGFGIELDPKYVDVCLKRWEKMTGKEPVLDGTGLTFAKICAQRQSEKVQPHPEIAPAPIAAT